jgi:hypothetical protein
MRMSAAPGKNDIHYCPETINGLPALIITPHSGVDGCMPTLNKLKLAAFSMAQERFVLDKMLMCSPLEVSLI